MHISGFFYIIMYWSYDLPAKEGLERNSRLEPIIHIFFKYFAMGNPYNYSVLSSPVEIILKGVDILPYIRNLWKLTYKTKKACNHCTQQWQNYHCHLVLVRGAHYEKHCFITSDTGAHNYVIAHIYEYKNTHTHL